MSNNKDVPYSQIHRIMDKHVALRTLSQTHLQKVLDTLTRYGIDKQDIAEHPKVLTIRPGTIENYTMILEEGGFTLVTARRLVGYLPLIRKPVRLLKVHNYIPPDTDVAKSMLSYLSEPPPPLDSFSNNNDWNNRSLMDVKVAVLKHYLMWRLDFQPDELESVLKIYVRIRHMSFRLIEKSLKILEEEIGFSREKIRRNGYLIHTHPDNTLEILNQFKTLAGVDIKTLCLKVPKLLASSTDRLLQKAQLLHDFGIPDAAVQRYLDVFSLGNKTVIQRLAAVESVPEFRGLAKNPRVLGLVHYHRKACCRLHYLQEMKFRCVSLHILSTTDASFDRYVREGSDRTGGNDIVTFLSVEFDANKASIRKELRRHPYWSYVPLLTVRDTLDFLLNRGFSRDQIFFSIHALLYSRSQLEKELDSLSSYSELNFDCPTYQQPPAVEAHEGKTCHLLPEHRLALCVYFIERNFHFTGDGVWGDAVASTVTRVCPTHEAVNHEQALLSVDIETVK